MARKKNLHRLRVVLLLFGLMLLVGAIGGGISASRLMARRPAYLDLPRAAVERTDLRAAVAVAGTIDTAKKTIIECELEAYFSQNSRAGGVAAIIELVPDGTIVKKGDMIARLDASEYEEMVRQQEILLLQATADEQKARLDLKSAEIGLREYRDGQFPQLREFYDSQIVLYQSEIQRAKDRLDWTNQMVSNGYVSPGQALNDHATLDRAEVNLANVRGQRRVLVEQTAAVEVQRLTLQIETQQGELEYQTMRLENRKDQLRKSRNQVEACTIRAPHAGMVIYASNFNPGAQQIELGAIAFNHMALCYLPDLSKTEVKVDLNESEIRKVHVGQLARIRVDSASSLLLEGHVKSIDNLAMEPKRWWLSREIRNFGAVITIHSPPPTILPGMSAEVQIQTDVKSAVLAVPATAVTKENGREIVFVVGPDGLERRAVDVDSGDTQRLEVRAGLAEGEQVIVEPSRLDPTDTETAGTTEGPSLGNAAPLTSSPAAHSAL